MSRDSCNQSHPLLGFSVSQPALGCPLEFFPAMGSQELDDMIHTYIPGPNSIMDKRAAVSMEFFSHNLETGELFKFFMVYQNASATTSPASSSGMVDSGYCSSFNTSPVISESQWSQSTSSSCTKSRTSSKKAATAASRPQDFSHIPGFSIMTKDGQDVTHSASRGMKTKEQRDHAHLMRVIKACESCRKKKTRCDPSHKKRASAASSTSESNARAFRKSKKAASTVAPSISSAKAQSLLASSQPVPAMTAESLLFDFTSPADEAAAEGWEQFVQYDAPLAPAAAPNDWEFFFDTAGYYSPSTSHTNSTPMSSSRVLTPSLPVTPASAEVVGSGFRATGLGQEPVVPYLNPGGLVDAGNNYADFSLYSPESTCLDDDPAFTQEIAASKPDYTATSPSQRRTRIDQLETVFTLQAQASPSERHPSISRQPESIGTLPSPANSSAMQSWSDDSALASELQLCSQDQAVAGLNASAGRALSSSQRVQTIDRGDSIQKPLSPTSAKQSVVSDCRDDTGTVSAGAGMSPTAPDAAAHGLFGGCSLNSSVVNDRRHVADVRDHGQDDAPAHGQDNVRDRRQSSSHDIKALPSGDLGTQIPKTRPDVEHAQAAPRNKRRSGQSRRDDHDQPLATRAKYACSAGGHSGTATCLQSMAALVQGAAVLAVLATFVGQLSSWWPQRETKGPWEDLSRTLPPVASLLSSERPSSASGTKKTTLAGRSLLSTVASGFRDRKSGWAGTTVHRAPLAVIG